VGVKGSAAIYVQLQVAGKTLRMEVDTGAAVSVISEKMVKELWPHAQLHPSTVELKTYTGEHLQVVGELVVDAQYEEQSAQQLCLIGECCGKQGGKFSAPNLPPCCIGEFCGVYNLALILGSSF